MRSGMTGLASPHPIGQCLPAVYLEDPFTQRFTAALDDVLAPVFLALDSFGSYLDPDLTPEDFLSWLAGWVAFGVDESAGLALRRDLVRHAVDLHRWRGTARGLAEHVRLLTGGEVEVDDSGGCGYSEEPGGVLPGTGPARVCVRVRVPDPAAVELPQLRAAVAELVPAHVRVTVDVTPMEQAAEQ